MRIYMKISQYQILSVGYGTRLTVKHLIRSMNLEKLFEMGRLLLSASSMLYLLNVPAPALLVPLEADKTDKAEKASRKRSV